LPTTKGKTLSNEASCPFSGGARPSTIARSARNADWWPEQLDLKPLQQQSSLSNPMEPDFDYAVAFNSLDLDAVIQDLHALMTDSQDW
jgi:catalase-peroxidase